MAAVANAATTSSIMVLVMGIGTTPIAGFGMSLADHGGPPSALCPT
jgi:hypothetical protein